MAAVWNFVALNQTFPSILLPPAFPSLHARESHHTKKTCPSCHCSVSEALTEASDSARGSSADPASEWHTLEALRGDLALSLTVRWPQDCPPVGANHQQAILQKWCFVKTSESVATAARKIKCVSCLFKKRYSFPLSLLFFSLSTKTYN